MLPLAFILLAYLCSEMKSTFPVYNIASLSEFRTDDFLVSRFGPYLQIHKNLHASHRHDFYHIVLFTEGSGSHQIDFQKFDVKPYQMYFMIPGQVHNWDFQDPVDGYVINFSASFFQSFLLNPNYLGEFNFFSGSVADQVHQIPENSGPAIASLFESILEEGHYSKPFGEDMIRVLLLNMLIRVSRTVPALGTDKKSAYNDTLLKSFKRLIESNYKSLRLPKDYASMLYITPNHLNSLCNDLLGMAAGELIRNRVVLEAKRLLVNLDIPVSEVADKLNFSDNSYFSKFFKKQAGLTPEEFRKRALQTYYGNDRN
jgi:AraC family transcriptional regulator, transcriptional activator of pobA